MVYLIKAWINDSQPQIWREIEVDQGTMLPDFHKILQTVMGWTNSHLHQFRKGTTYYTDTDYEEFNRENVVDYKNMRIIDLLKSKGEEIIYEYDFGDNWAHNIKLLEVYEEQEGEFYPRCIAGERSCPPEDSSGIYGYQEMLKVIKKKGHPDYDDMQEWIGESFDPEYYNISDVNESLQEENFGFLEILE